MFWNTWISGNGFMMRPSAIYNNHYIEVYAPVEMLRDVLDIIKQHPEVQNAHLSSESKSMDHPWKTKRVGWFRWEPVQIDWYTICINQTPDSYNSTVGEIRRMIAGYLAKQLHTMWEEGAGYER